MIKELYGYGIDSDGFIWRKDGTAPLKVKLDKDGYETVRLSYDGKGHDWRVHRLIALAFVDNPNPKKFNIVNHLDNNKRNNKPENLEWTDVQGNTKHGYDFGRLKINQRKATEASKEVTIKTYNVYKDGVFIGSYKGLNNTANAIKVSVKTITNCIRENRKTREGYYFTKNET